MGFFKTLFLIWLVFVVARMVRAMLLTYTASRTQKTEEKSNVALDAVACPRCGSYTTTKCDREDCAL